MRLRRLASLALLALALPAAARAQGNEKEKEKAPQRPTPPLASFASQSVAILPLQYYHADSIGWSKGTTFSATRAPFDSILAAELLDRGMGKRWLYAADVIRSAKRNPTSAVDPAAVGVGRWRVKAPRNGEEIPMLLADNLRPLTAITGARYALIPVEIRGEGERAVLRLVMADTRVRTVVFAIDLSATGDAKVLQSLATGFANLVLEP